jgi:LPS export ABC transporter permease LptG
VLGTIGALSRTGELTVMRACGISLYRVALPLVLLSLLWSGGLFLLEERVLARANRVAETLEDRIRDRAPRTVNVANLNWMAGERGRIYYYAVFDRQIDTLYALSVYDTARAPYRITAHTFARQAVLADEGWLAGSGWIQSFPADGSLQRERFEQRHLALATIEEFDRSQVDTTLMTYGEQRDYIAQLEASGYSVARQRVELQRKLAFPLVTLVMTLMAIPFGVTTGRRGALYGIGLAIMLAFGYWFLTTIFMAAGAASLLPATMAAWAANILFLAAAGYMLLTVRT